MTNDDVPDSINELELACFLSKIDERMEASSAELKSLQAITCQGLAGQYFGPMMRDRRLAEAFLVDPNPRLRIAAIAILSRHHGAIEEFADRFEQIGATDCDSTVRLSAMLTLLRWYRAQRDSRAIAILEDLVDDPTVADEIRQELKVFRGDLEDK